MSDFDNTQFVDPEIFAEGRDIEVDTRPAKKQCAEAIVALANKTRHDVLPADIIIAGLS